jgi:sodium-dependent dicarboxylate transporter 2/3/5
MIAQPSQPEPEAAGTSTRRRAGGLLVAFLLFAGIGFGLRLDPTAVALNGLDPAKVMLGLGICACVAVLWLTEALPLAITALLVPVLACSFGLMEMKAALAGFSDPLIFLFFGGFAIAAALSGQGLDRWMAHRIVRLGKGDFLSVCYLLFGVTAAIAMWVSHTATTAMMLPLALGILRQMPRSEGTARNTIFLLLGVAYSSSVGGIGTLVGTPPNGIAAAQLGIGFLEWLKFGIPAVLVLMPLLVVVLRRACRPEKIHIPDLERLEFRFTRARVLTLVIFGLTAAGWVFSEPLAKRLGATGAFNTLVALIAVVALVSSGVLRWQEIRKNTDWGVLLLFGGGITLSTLIAQTGAGLWLARLFSEWVEFWPVPLVIGAVIFFMVFLTELISNTALTALMVPIFFLISGEMGIHPNKLILPLTIAASTGFMMPVGTPPNALVFATDKVPQREMMRVGLILNLVFIVALTILSEILF